MRNKGTSIENKEETRFREDADCLVDWGSVSE